MVDAGVTSPVREDGKVVVHFRHTGSAPILRQQKFKVPSDARFSTVTTLLRKQLGMTPDNSLVRSSTLPLFFFHCTSTRVLDVRLALTPPPATRLTCDSFCIATAPSRRHLTSESRM